MWVRIGDLDRDTLTAAGIANDLREPLEDNEQMAYVHVPSGSRVTAISTADLSVPPPEPARQDAPMFRVYLFAPGEVTPSTVHEITGGVLRGITPYSRFTEGSMEPPRFNSAYAATRAAVEQFLAKSETPGVW